jgi:hypothetical protein
MRIWDCFFYEGYKVLPRSPRSMLYVTRRMLLAVVGCCPLHVACCVGHKVLFRVGCALLKIHQDELLKMREMMDAMQYLQKHVPQSCNIDRTLHVRPGVP